MTTPELEVTAPDETSGLPIDLPVEEPASSPASVPDIVDEVPVKKGRRGKVIFLAFLAIVFAVTAIVGGWYLISRKPLPEVLPGIVTVKLPSFAFAIYGISKPMGVAVSPSGDRIYVAETEGGRYLHVYDGKGQQLASVAPPGSTQGSRVPAYVAVDPLTGSVYVSDRMKGSIYVYDRDGTYLSTFVPKPAMSTFLPLGLAFDTAGNLYVGDLDPAFHRVLVFGRDGVLTRTVGTVGTFNFPNGLAVDGAGNLYVANSNDGRVLVFDATGKETGSIPRGVGTGELGLPRGIALDDQTRLYVVDTTGQAIQIYATGQADGRPKYVGTAGEEGTGDGQFEYPFGAATDTRGRIYVADWANDRVQVWSY
jgi:DNA-binding beta-propeller fold protein YncE